MKKPYENPKLAILLFDEDDFIRTSPGGDQTTMPDGNGSMIEPGTNPDEPFA